MSQIKVDTTEVYEAIQDISMALSSKNVPKLFLEKCLDLKKSDSFKNSIFIRTATTLTNDHIIRLGICGMIELLATAVRTQNFDKLLGHT